MQATKQDRSTTTPQAVREAYNRPTWAWRLGSGLLAVVFVFTIASAAFARDLHVAPGASGDGSSADSPLGDVGAALRAAADGDTVLLHPGYYGDVTVSGRFGAPTTVRATESGVNLRTLSISGAENLHIEGLSISVSHAPTYRKDMMVNVDAASSDVTLSDCDIFAVPDAVASGWGASDWINVAADGVFVRGPRVTLRGNRLRNLGYVIQIYYSATHVLVSGNDIANFSRDALRGLADFGVYENNTARNAYDVDDHHDDFFQSWTFRDGAVGAGVVRGVVIRGNTFIGFDDPSHRFAGAPQGIGCFDGFFEDWVVENNVVAVNHWHGISFYGARNLRIVNNTVVDADPTVSPGPPWILVTAHKNGTRSSDAVVRNNLVETINIEHTDGAVEDHNLSFASGPDPFVDRAGFDFHLVETAAAVDSGSDTGAPEMDRDSVPRPQGSGMDVGAFEHHDGEVVPVDAGTPPADAGASDAGMTTDAGTMSDAGIPSGGDAFGGADVETGGDSGSGPSPAPGASPTDRTIMGSCSVGAEPSRHSVFLLFGLVVLVSRVWRLRNL